MTPREEAPRPSGPYRGLPLGEPDPAPNPINAAARAAFDATRPARLAILVHDSLVDGNEPAQKHVLRFEHHQLGVQLHVCVERDRTVIEGLLDDRGPARAVLHFHGAETALVEPVEGATFEFSPVGHGLVRISLEKDDETAIWTDWFRI